MKKRILALVLIVALSTALFAVFTGCGNKDSASESGSTAKQTYTVTFNSDGGTAVASATVTDGEKVSKPTNPTKNSLQQNYEFTGWFNGDDEWNFDTDTVTENITLTAKWKLSEDYTKGYAPEN